MIFSIGDYIELREEFNLDDMDYKGHIVKITEASESTVTLHIKIGENIKNYSFSNFIFFITSYKKIKSESIAVHIKGKTKLK